MQSAPAPAGTISQEQNVLEQAKADVEKALAKKNKIEGGMFSPYNNLLSHSAQTKWTKFVASQVGAVPRTNLNDKVINKPARNQ